MTVQGEFARWVRAAAPIACVVLLYGAPARGASPIPTPTAVAPSRVQDASLDAYRKHLTALTTLVEGCADARDLKSCDPLLVGPDDRIPLSNAANAPRRLVRYGWLRVLFSKAEEPDVPKSEGKKKTEEEQEPESAELPPPLVSQLLKDAETRLAADLAQADASAGTSPKHALERATMNDVLAGRDFRGLEQPTARDTFLEKLGTWLNKFFESATKLRAQSAWVGRLIVWGFIGGVCVLLVWGLLQLERKWRVRLVPEDRTPAPGAASARNWQLWLDDARRAAAAGQWREAIHFVYWASISRLESRRLWPADRARTPREYLALVAPDDARKAGLTTLTGSFERTWYGGRPAGEGDYKRAEELATALIGGGSGAASSEGGAG